MTLTAAARRNGEVSSSSSTGERSFVRFEARSAAPAPRMPDVEDLRRAQRIVRSEAPRPPQRAGLAAPPSAQSASRSTALHRVTRAGNDPAIHGRPLTSKEIGMLYPLFGDALDYREVRVFNKKYTIFQSDDVAMAPDGNIYMPRESPYYADDFAEAEPWKQVLFVHEMAHVWQKQMGHNVLVEAGVLHLFCSDPYAYELEWTRTLDDYNLEQQADIIAHYFVLTRHPSSASSYESIRRPIDAYRRTLADFLNDPAYPRRREQERLEAASELASS